VRGVNERLGPTLTLPILMPSTDVMAPVAGRLAASGWKADCVSGIGIGSSISKLDARRSARVEGGLKLRA